MNFFLAPHAGACIEIVVVGDYVERGVSPLTQGRELKFDERLKVLDYLMSRPSRRGVN